MAYLATNNKYLNHIQFFICKLQWLYFTYKFFNWLILYPLVLSFLLILLKNFFGSFVIPLSLCESFMCLF